MVRNDHHEVTTNDEVKNVGVCNDPHEVITKEGREKLRYVMIIIK